MVFWGKTGSGNHHLPDADQVFLSCMMNGNNRSIHSGNASGTALVLTDIPALNQSFSWIFLSLINPGNGLLLPGTSWAQGEMLVCPQPADGPGTRMDRPNSHNEWFRIAFRSVLYRGRSLPDACNGSFGNIDAHERGVPCPKKGQPRKIQGRENTVCTKTADRQ